MSGVQSNAMLDLDLDLDLGKDSVHVSSTSSGSNERQLLSEIELMLVEHPEGVRKEKQKVINTILNMREKINRLRQMAENVEKYDIKTYRERALDVENSLTDLYNNNLFRLGQLKCDQMDILASLPDSSELLKEESKYTAKRSTRPKKRSNRTEEADNIPTTQSHYYRAVKDFDNFLKANGGHTGGWNEEQHSVYVALHAKYKNNAIKVENALREILPGKQQLLSVKLI